MCGNNGCFGGGNIWWIIILILLFCNCGWGGNMNWGGNNCCDKIPIMEVDNCVRICSCWFVGKTSMIRFTVP